MALTTCPDCGRDVSASAPTCPHCGRPIATTVAQADVHGSGAGPFRKGLGFTCGVLLAIVTGIIIIGMLSALLSRP